MQWAKVVMYVQGRIVAIDATVQRRPPGGLVSAEDAACNRLTELVLNDVQVHFSCAVSLSVWSFGNVKRIQTVSVQSPVTYIEK